MILEMILTVVKSLFSLFTSPIDIPNLPNDVSTFLDRAFSYLASGVGILVNYTDLVYLLILFGIIVAVDLGIAIYHFVMWVLRKIPFVNVS